MKIYDKVYMKTVTKPREVWEAYSFLIIFSVLGVVGIVFLNNYIG
jgi:hypothetical protein